MLLRSIFAALRIHRWPARTMANLLLMGLLFGEVRAAASRGLPYSRLYSFDEIGDVSNGADLDFDAQGRLALVKDGVCMILDDGTWLNLSDPTEREITIQHIIFDGKNAAYFGAVGTWGLLHLTEKGLLHPEPLKPAASPAWTLKTEFSGALRTTNGVCFYGFNGLAYWFRATNQTRFHQISGLVRVFSLSGKIFVSTYDRGTRILDTDTGELVPAPQPFASLIVSHIANLPDDRAIVSVGPEIMIYHAGEFTVVHGPWDAARIASMQSLPEGNVALAVVGKGLFILDAQGKIVSAVTDTEYRRISALASREPGVLWAETESGVLKILYDSPITVFGQALGLAIRWPQLLSWQKRVYIASAGLLYEAEPPHTAEPLHFSFPSEPVPGGVWALAAWRDWLLAGGSRGLFGRKAGGSFEKISSNVDVGKLFITETGLCFVVGTDQIALFKCDGDRWQEIATRVPGVGYPAAGLAVKNAVWVEVGANVAVRLSFDGEKIETRIIDSFPWHDPRWIHISAIGDTIVLAGPESGRIFFNETKGEVEDHSPLEKRLDAGPFWPARIKVDDVGTWWISHQHGIYLNYLKDDRTVIDNTTYRTIDEHISTIHVLDDNQIWMSTGSSLYNLERRANAAPPLTLQPMLVSVQDARTGNDLMLAGFSNGSSLLFSQNSVALRFFSGSYAVRQGLQYEVSINKSDWSRLDGSMLTLSNLHEGKYHLSVRLVDVEGVIGKTSDFDFTVSPPLARTWYAWLAYFAAFWAGVFGLSYFLLFRARRRSAALEKTVAERNRELKQAMTKLEDEARTTATLAERNRLAGEIHDSLEQSFSALSLQLETTANFPHCPPEVERGLSLARNMVSFSRDEIRHAIWDLHSPLLDHEGLEGALRRLMAQLAIDSIQSSLELTGESRSLSSTTEHHLLRIAQEAIANAVKHANAQKILVQLTYETHEVVLSVSDDGRGFEPHTILEGPSGHFGLRSLRSRATKMEGSLTINSSPQRGTSIVARVPYSDH